MKKIIKLILLFVTFSASVYAQDKCQDIIKERLFEKLELDRNNSFEESFDKYIESSKFSEFASDDRFGFDIGIPLKLGKLGFGVNSKDMTIQKFQDIFKNSISIDNKAVIREYLKNEVASKVLTDAWSKCMDGDNKIGLIYKLEYTDKSPIVILRIKWAPRLNVNQVVLSNDITVINGENSSDCLEKGTLVGTEWISCVFKRDNLSTDLVIQIPLANQLGSTIIKVDGKAEVKKSITDLCFEGNLEACRQLVDESRKNIKKIEDGKLARFKQCEMLDEKGKFNCINKVSFELDKAYSNHSMLEQIVKKISEVNGLCAISLESEKCIKNRKLLSLDIFNFINAIPISVSEIYTFKFSHSKN